VLEQAIAAAVREELAQHGYAATTYEAVAARAGTSKPVLYRRWATKSEMVLAGLLSAPPIPAPAVDTGSLDGDLKAMLAATRDLFQRLLGRDIVLHLMAELPDPAAQDLKKLLFTRRTELVGPVLDRARRRGELNQAPLPPTALDLPFDLALHELLVYGRLTDHRIDTIVDQVVIPLFVAQSQADKGPRHPVAGSDGT
jgi:AcrR family transcriptional regulator